MAIKFVTAGAWGPGEGAPLNPADVDENFYEALQRIIALETTPPTAVSIDTITIVGNEITFTMTDATTRGPFVIPTFTPRAMGAWLPLISYKPFDFFTNAGSLYQVLIAHDSVAPFDPDALDPTLLLPLYNLVLAPPSTPNDLHVFVSGPTSDNQLIMSYQTTRRFNIPALLFGSLFTARVAALADTAFDLQKNGSSLGTLTWLAGTTTPVVVFTTSTDFDFTDTFDIVGPTIADTDLADISFDIVGNRF